MATNIKTNPLNPQLKDEEKIYNGTFVGDLTGNADSATQLKQDFTVTFAEDVSGSFTTKGSNVQARLTVNHSLRADSAKHADTADNVANADYAKEAGYAANAGTASKAATATIAEKANSASQAEEAAHAAKATFSLESHSASIAAKAITADNANYAEIAGTAKEALKVNENTWISKANYAKEANLAKYAQRDCEGFSIKDTYLKKEDAKETYLNKEDASETYLAIDTAEKDYLKKVDAGNTYLSKTDANADYLKKTDASNTYQTKAGMKDYMPKSGGDFTGNVTLPDQASLTEAQEKSLLNKKDIQSLIDKSIAQSGGGGGEQANNIKPVDSYPTDADLQTNYLYAQKTDAVINSIKIKDETGAVNSVDFKAMKQATTKAQTQADKGVADAKTAQTKANTNATNITALQGDMSTAQSNITATTNKANANATDIDKLQADLAKTNTAVSKAQSTADGKISKTGDTVTGTIIFNKAPEIVTHSGDIQNVADKLGLNKGDIKLLIEYMANTYHYPNPLWDMPLIQMALCGGSITKEVISQRLEGTGYIIWENISIPKTETPCINAYFGDAWTDPDNAENNLLPDPNEYFLMMTTDPAQVGKQQKAESPNSIGTFGADAINNNSGNMLLWGFYGTFYNLGRSITSAAYSPDGSAIVSAVGFDLSKGNAIYSGTTVKPKNLGVLPLLKL